MDLFRINETGKEETIDLDERLEWRATRESGRRINSFHHDEKLSQIDAPGRCSRNVCVRRDMPQKRTSAFKPVGPAMKCE